MLIEAKVTKGGFDCKQTTITFEIENDPYVLGQLNGLLDKRLSARIQNLTFNCKLNKGGFDQKHTSFVLSLKAGTPMIAQFSELAYGEYTVTLELEDPQLTIPDPQRIMTTFASEVAKLEGIDSVKIDGVEIMNSKRASERPKTNEMLTQPEKLENIISDNPFEGVAFVPEEESGEEDDEADEPEVEQVAESVGGVIQVVKKVLKRQEITCVKDIKKTVNAEGFELFNGNLYKDLTGRERKIVDSMDFQGDEK